MKEVEDKPLKSEPLKPEEVSFSEDIRNAVETLRKGGVILYPTDTVWGLGCDASNEEAVKKIYNIKKRQDSKSMLVLVDGEAMLERSVKDIPEIAWQLIEAAVDPLTIIYDNPVNVADNLKADDGSLGIRITVEKFSKTLCARIRGPVVSTSANISGKPAPSIFKEIDPEIISQVDYVVNYRRDDNKKSVPSEIIKLSEGGVVKIIRNGKGPQ